MIGGAILFILMLVLVFKVALGGKANAQK
jgi:hypothetical protein